MSTDPSRRSSHPSPLGASDPGLHAPGSSTASWSGGKLVLEEGAVPVDGYTLQQRLGRGGFGEVWQATGPGGFQVAMKFIRLEENAGAVELRSLQLTKQLKHPNLLAQFGAWEKDGYLIIAMELGNGTLHDRLKADTARGLPGIPREELLEYMREAAKAIDYLNGQNIQHRDIKPQNLLLVGTGVKVADFGLAKLLEHTATAASGSMTPAYAAPEFFNGQATRWSDQYCLATSYCQMRGNALPFTGNAAQVVAGHLTRNPDLSMLPEEERPVVARALAKDPARRWPNCLAFVEALQGVALTQHAGHFAPPAFPPTAGVSSTTKMPQAQMPTERPAPAWRGGPSGTLPVPPAPAAPVPVRGGQHTALILIAALLLGGGAGIGLLVWLNQGPADPRATEVVHAASSTAATAPQGTAAGTRPAPEDDDPDDPQPGGKGVRGSRPGRGGRRRPPDPLPPAPTKPEPTEPKILPALLLPMLPPVTLEAGARVKITVTFARMNCPGPVEVRLVNLPVGVRSSTVTVPAEQKGAVLELTAQADAPVTNRRIQIEAVSGTTRATMPLQLDVKAAAAFLRVWPLPELVLLAGHATSMNLRVERRHCPGDLALRWEGLPPGVTASPRQLPANFDVVTVTFKAEPGTAMGRYALKLTAEHPRTPAQAETKLAVLPYQPDDDQRWLHLPDGMRHLFSLYEPPRRESLVLLLDPATGQPLSSLYQLPGRAGFCRASPESRRFALANLPEAGNRSEIRIMDAVSGRWVGATIRLEERLHDLTFSADGHRLLVGAGKELLCWDAAKGTLLWKCPLEAEPVRLAAAPNRIACSLSQSLLVVDEKTGKEVWKVPASGGTYGGLDLSPSGLLLAAIHSDKAVHVYDGATGRRRASLSHPGTVHWAVISPDGRTLATCCADKTVRLWSLGSNTVLRSLTHEQPAFRAWFTEDGDSLITTEAGNFHRWNVRTGQRIGDPFPRRTATFVAPVTADRRRAVVRLWDATARVWDLQTRRPVSPPLEHPVWVSFAAFSPDGRELLTGSRDGSTCVWNVDSGRRLTPIRRHRDMVTRGLFSRDGRIVATVSTAVGRAEVKVWDARTGNTVGSAPDLPPLLNDLDFLPDGTRLAALCGGKTVLVWDARSGKELWRNTLTSNGLRITVSPDGKEVRIEGSGKMQRLDASTGKVLEGTAPNMIGD